MLSGQQVANDDVRGALRFGDVLLGGLSGFIDLELRSREAELIGDKATVNKDGTAQTPSPQNSYVNLPAAVDTVKQLAWWQWGGLMLAGGLTYALVTGRFR